MPRNSSGVYTLPAGNPVVTDTVIDVDWANPTMEDIGNELTLSLPRNGSAGMLGPLMLIQSAVAPLEAVPLQQLQGYLPLTGGTLNGDLVFGGVGRRIKANFSTTSPFSDRLYFQTTVANDYTAVGAIPNGTSLTSAFNAYNSSDPNNASSISINCSATIASLAAGRSGTGSYLPIAFLTSNVERMRIDTDGNIGINGAGAGGTYRVDIRGNVDGSAGMYYRTYNESTGANAICGYSANTNGVVAGLTAAPTYGAIGTDSNHHLTIRTNSSERMRIGTNGNIGVGTTDTSYRMNLQSSSNFNPVLYVAHTNVASGQVAIRTELTTANNNTTSAHLTSITSGVSSWHLYGNGTMSFTSDERQKKNIETTRDGYVADLAKLRVVKYNWINDDDGTPKELGLIAQEVEQIFPGLITESELEGVGVRKGLKFSVLPFMMLKAIQELKAEVDDLRSQLLA